MERILMMVLRNIFIVPFIWIKLCYRSKHADKYSDEQHNKMFKYIVEKANKGGNVSIKSYGIDNIPKENGFMLFPNHQGMYDVLAIINGCNKPISVVYKIELKKLYYFSRRNTIKERK